MSTAYGWTADTEPARVAADVRALAASGLTVLMHRDQLEALAAVLERTTQAQTTSHSTGPTKVLDTTDVVVPVVATQGVRRGRKAKR